MSEREMVGEFHRAMGLPVRTTPTMPSEADRLLRCKLLLEECEEFIHASGCRINTDSAGRRTIAVDHRLKPDLAAMAHENADVRVITHGNDLTMGAPPEVFAEVHRANMSKLGDDGKPVLRADGKVTKGPNYKPPDVAGVLARAASEQPCECGHHGGWHHLGKKRACVKKLSDGNICPCKQWNPAEAP